MKQTSEQYFNNLPQEPEVTYVSAWCPSTTYVCSAYCEPTYTTFNPPEGFKTCPECDGDGTVEVEWYDEDDEECYYENENCDFCHGAGYVSEKKYNKWKKENE